MCHTVRTSIACDPAAVRIAREWLREQLHSLYTDLDGDLVQDATLTVSELVTNCVRADAHQLTVTLTAHRGDMVIATTDDAPGVPQRRSPAPETPCGRGLQIVEALTDEWGVSPSDTTKTVWTRFALAGVAAGAAPRMPGSSFDCDR